MSLGVSSGIEDEIKRCLDEIGGGLPIEVAWWRFNNGLELKCFGEIGCAMLRMEERGVLAFVDGRYEVAQQGE